MHSTPEIKDFEFQNQWRLNLNPSFRMEEIMNNFESFTKV